MQIGYARVSAQDQYPELQFDALRAAGCKEIFHEKQSGKTKNRHGGLAQCLRMLRKGDVLVVWRMDPP